MSTSPQRSAWLPSVRVYVWERELLDRAAEHEGVKMAEFVRAVLLSAARRRLARAEPEA
jgi:uncharacterized protein (DUF1778 family)